MAEKDARTKAAVERHALSLRARSAAGSFHLEHDSYRANYEKLYGIYQDLHNKRVELQGRAADVDTSAVSRNLTGVAVGAFKVGDAVGGRNDSRGGMIVSTPGMVPAMLGLEAALAKLLVGLHDAYVAYMRGDEMASQLLIQAAADSPVGYNTGRRPI